MRCDISQRRIYGKGVDTPLGQCSGGLEGIEWGVERARLSSHPRIAKDGIYSWIHAL